MPSNDDIVLAMLGQQPAGSGPLPGQGQQPDPQAAFSDALKAIQDYHAQSGQQPAAPAPSAQPSVSDQHMDRINQFWAGQNQPSMLADNPRGYGSGPPSAVVMLLEVGCTTAEVQAITGQSMQMAS